MKRVSPLTVSVANLSLSHSSPISPAVFFLPLCGYQQYAPYRIPSKLYARKSHPQLSYHASQPPTKLLKEKPKVVHYFCLLPKTTHVQRYKLRLFCFYQAPFYVVRSSCCSPPAQLFQAAFRQCRNARTIRYCLPFSLDDIEYISQLNLIGNTGE